MYISSLSIVNFKNFKHSTFKFVKDSVNTIIGENAAGKTNVFQAMRLVLDESLPSNVKQLTSDDFHRGLGQPFGHWIVIAIFFDDLSDTEEEQVLANYVLNTHGKLKSTGKGTYTFLFRPKFYIRQALYDIATGHDTRHQREESFNNLVSGLLIGRETYEAIAFTRTTLDFTNEVTYRDKVGDFEDYIFPDPNQENAAEIGIQKPPYFSIVSEVACTYVKALRNVVSDLKYYKTNPLYKLLTLKSKEINDQNNVVEDIINVNKKISSIPEIDSLSKNISRSLLNTVGSTYSPKICVSSQLPEDFTELVQSLGLIVEDSMYYQGTGRIEDLSLGGANLIYLALKLYEYESIRDSAEHITHFLLIEEPEAHIHNHIQKTLFDTFNFNNTQVFVSTHSTQISSSSKISSMNILSRKETETEVYSPAYGLELRQVKRMERYLDAIRSDVLFAKSTILVEGDAELILIPAMVKSALGVSLDEMGISLVKVDGTVFKHVCNLFHEKRIRNYCAILTDLDAAYITEVNDTFATADYIKSQFAAQESGSMRKSELDEYTVGNDYTEAYYAKNTFETELIENNKNISMFTKVVNNEYTRQYDKNRVNENLSSDYLPLRYDSVLKLAKKVGKGWLATELVDHIDHNCHIPDYVLNALMFALKGRNIDDILWKMMNYNIELMNAESQSLFDVTKSLKENIKIHTSHWDNSFSRFVSL
ncbi:AAA family ATPase [Photobacterium carnosum]|uniref:ATP-dependent nuclease n=1 Tax=Photobacterium carnosum TaxID=2023717 RepID=UPI001E53547C|nr:AAA family ATPase [Photobacterium carnosum]MCD9540614.1 AAA family ATPase [Photobacterium carnosum]